jgi:hypothetical protein
MPRAGITKAKHSRIVGSGGYLLRLSSPITYCELFSVGRCEILVCTSLL